ncbi:hypothetical protein [Coprobacter sp.]
MFNEWGKQNLYKGTYMHPEDVYKDYPEGGRLGWWFICHETSSVWAWNIFTEKWENSSASAYEIAVKYGYKGSEQEWVNEFGGWVEEAKSATRKALESASQAMEASDKVLLSAKEVALAIDRSEDVIKRADSAVKRVDAELIKGTRFKGYFLNETLLRRKWPSPQVGDYAWVGTVYPGVLAECVTSEVWRLTETVPQIPSVDLADYALKEKLLNKQDKSVNVLVSGMNIFPAEKENVVSFFIDAFLTGFDCGTEESPRYYGPSSIVSRTKVVTIYEVDEDGKYKDATAPLLICTVKKMSGNVAFMEGHSGDGSKKASFIVDWGQLPDNEDVVYGVQFTDACFQSHYGPLNDWEELSSIEKSVNTKLDVNRYSEDISSLFKFGINDDEVQSKNITKMPGYSFWGIYGNTFLRMNRIAFWVTADHDFVADGVDLYVCPDFTGGESGIGSALPNITGGMFVTIGLNGKVIYNQDISQNWILSHLNDQTRLSSFEPYSDPPEAYKYRIPLKLSLNEGDSLYIGYGTKNLSEYFTPIYFMNKPLEGTMYSGGRFFIQNSVSVAAGVIPEKPLNSATDDSWYMCFDLYQRDYLEQKIKNVVYGSKKERLNLISPEIIYTVANNVDKSLFPKRQYAIPVYLDHCVNRLVNRELTACFEETGDEKVLICSSRPNDQLCGVSADTVYTKSLVKSINGGEDWENTQITFQHVSVPEVTGENAVTRYLAIGDSVTDGYLSDNCNKEGFASKYWAVVQEQFKYAQNESGNEEKHRCVTLGTQSRDIFKVNDSVINAYAEGYGGWCSTDHVYYACCRSSDTDKQGIWDLLGLGDGTGSDWTGSAEQQKLMNMTGEGFYAPKDTEAFRRYINSRHEQSFTTYQQCIDFLQSYYEHPQNPFFDYGKHGKVKFSIKKWLERYRTLLDDGTTRCNIDNKGTLVTDVNEFDVCLPSHITLAHSHNDLNKIYIQEVYRAWTDSIRAEYALNNWGKVYIGLHIIDFVGSYYPSKYAQILPVTPLWESGIHGYENYKRISSEFLNDGSNGIFILPSLFISHPAFSAPVRNADSPEYEIIGDKRFEHKVINGGGPLWHPNALAHRCWGIEIYAWIRFTYSLQ